MKMDNKTLLFFLIILHSCLLLGQNDPVIIEKSSLFALPDNMPLQTKLLWSENGLLRKTKLFNVDRPKELILRKKMLQLHQKLALGTLLGCVPFLSRESTIVDPLLLLATDDNLKKMLSGDFSTFRGPP